MTVPYVLIVDDHKILARSLEVALDAEGIDVTTVSGPTPADIWEAVEARTPELVLLDLDLAPDVGSGLQFIGPLKELDVMVVMLTGSSDTKAIAECVEAGATGVLNKSDSFDQLLQSIHTVLRDGALMSENDRQVHLATLRGLRSAQNRAHAPFRSLTPRENEVLGQLLKGKSADEIAKEWTVSTATVRSQIRAVLSKLGVNSQLAATAKAREAKWMSD